MSEKIGNAKYPIVCDFTGFGVAMVAPKPNAPPRPAAQPGARLGENQLLTKIPPWNKIAFVSIFGK